MNEQADEVLRFWEEAGPEKWYKKDPGFDAEITERFGALWEQAAAGAFDECWGAEPRSTLALIILLDQFPRNMFREDGRAFASDDRALSMACYAINHGYDLKIEGAMRQFVYMPFMHSERLTDQDHAVRLFAERMPGDNLLHARAHREIIRRFNRFPYRNDALGRRSSAAERAFIDEGGYGAILNDLREAA